MTGSSERTIVRFFWPGSNERARRIIGRVMSLTGDETSALLKTTLEDFRNPHPDLHRILEEHYRQAAEMAEHGADAGPERRLLIGAYFTMEYAFESAALFNPSVVPVRRQDGSGDLKVLISLRAVGEGHVSSIVFRTGVITADGDVVVDEAGPRARAMRPVEDPEYERAELQAKLREIGAHSEAVERFLAPLGERFTKRDLYRAFGSLRNERPEMAEMLEEARDRLLWIVESNYEIRYPAGGDMSEVVLFPVSSTESSGIEDMRLVRFTDDDGSICYYGTYTAYNGSDILPQMFESPAPDYVRVHTLSGRFARNKGLALFPRKVGGNYVMSARVDGENLYILRSDRLRVWDEGVKVQEPRYPWEFVQTGNCGSPIETDAGWLLLTHGVGPMRKYCIGASLLDLDDPARLVAQTSEPLLMPQEDERSGYVPNVVYSCGAVVHHGNLVIMIGQAIRAGI